MDPKQRFGPAARVALRVVLATLVPLVIVEATLQLGALVLRAAIDSRERTGGGSSGTTVLCVGDSYTYGLGASDAEHSYPGQLEARLRAADGRTWSVVNGGWPGRDSWDTLRELPGQIDYHHPDFVCVLAGLNDRWNHPQRHALAVGTDAAGEPDGQVGLRTIRLAKLLIDAWRRRGHGGPETAQSVSAPPSPPFVGTWTEAGRMVRFDADGFGFVKGDACTWRQAGDRLRLQFGDLPSIEVDWSVHDDRLRIAAMDGRDVLECARCRSVSAPLDADCLPPNRECDDALQRLYAEDFAGALAGLQEVLPAFPESVCIHAGLAQALSRLGRMQESEPHLRWLSAYYANHPTSSVAELYGWSIFAALPAQPGFESLKRLRADHPDLVVVLRTLAQRAHDVEDLATARDAIGRAIELTSDDDLLLKGELVRRRGSLVKDIDRDGALRDFLAGYVIDGDHGETMRVLRILLSQEDERRLRARVGGLALAPAESQRLLRLIDEAILDDETLSGILGFHLGEMSRCCRAHGARLLIVGYPMHTDFHERAAGELAATTGAPRVENAAEFDRQLERRAWADLFVSDGHCNDAGYAIVAERVAAKLRELAAAR